MSITIAELQKQIEESEDSAARLASHMAKIILQRDDLQARLEKADARVAELEKEVNHLEWIIADTDPDYLPIGVDQWEELHRKFYPENYVCKDLTVAMKEPDK